MIHLDTGFLIRGLRPGSVEDGALRGWLRAGESVGIGAVGWAEFLCGPVAETTIELAGRLLGKPVPFGTEEAALAASLLNRTGR